MNIKTSLNWLFLSIYKIIGFITLAAICVGILGYLTGSLFYIIDKRWVIPIILSPHSEQVVKLNSQHIQQKFLYNKTMVEKLRLQSKIRLLKEEVKVKKDLQKRFELAFKSDLKMMRQKLDLISEALKEHDDIEFTANGAYSRSELANISSLISAGIIDRQTYNRNKFSIDQNIRNLATFKQKEEQLKLEKNRLIKSISSLESFNNKIKKTDTKYKAEPIYDVLIIEQEYLILNQDVNGLENEIDMLNLESEIIDSSLEGYNEICEKLEQSPYFKAINKSVIVAFAPYSNIRNIKVNDPIYGCYLGLFLCKKIAVVKEVLEGEIIAKHPVFNKELRGMMVIIDMKDKDMDWAKAKSLHVGTKPFFIL